jgi:hypothetical protein
MPDQSYPQWLIVVATFRVGEHDGSFLRFDVHLGKLASVSLGESGRLDWS